MAKLGIIFYFGTLFIFVKNKIILYNMRSLSLDFIVSSLLIICSFFTVEHLSAQTQKINWGLTVVNDTFLVRSDRQQVYNILKNDRPSKDKKLGKVEVIRPPKGTLTFKQVRGLDYAYYSMDYGAAEKDQFTYKVCDTGGSCDTATVMLYWCPRNKLSFPTIVDTALLHDTPLSFNLPGMVIRPSVFPEKGKMTWNADSSQVTYTAPAGFVGSDKFNIISYIDAGICGMQHQESLNVRTYMIPEDGKNLPPVAVNDTVTIYSTSKKVKIDVLANDHDPEDNLKRRFPEYPQAEKGRVRRGTDTFTYEPRKGYYGKDSFVYKICDYNGACSEATVIVYIKKGSSGK